MKNERKFTVEEIKKILEEHIWEQRRRGMFNSVTDSWICGFEDAAKAIYDKYAS